MELTWSLKRTLPLTSSSSSCPKIAEVETTNAIKKIIFFIGNISFYKIIGE